MQTNAENKFLGTFFWKFIDLISFGVFEHKTPDDVKDPNADNSNTTYTNSTPGEPSFDV